MSSINDDIKKVTQAVIHEASGLDIARSVSTFILYSVFLIPNKNIW